MSIRTEADRHLELAKENINFAIKELSEILINECWGYDQWNNEYTEKINNTFDQLRKIKRDLGD